MSLDKEIRKNDPNKRQMRSGGLLSTRERKVIPGPRYPTSGNVTMAQNGAKYKFPNPYGATRLDFLGVAIRENQNGYVLTVDPLTRIPIAGKVYYLDGNPDHTIVITGSSSDTSIQAQPTNPDYQSVPTGLWREDESMDDVFGNSRITVNSVSVPTVNVRVALDGVAHLRPAYYFAPQSSTSVSVARKMKDPDGNKIIVQCSRYLLIVDENASASTPEYAASAGELHIVNVVWGGSIVARATITAYGPDFFEVTVTLASNWYIAGNFICT